jgi:hypothetical protein
MAAWKIRFIKEEYPWAIYSLLCGRRDVALPVKKIIDSQKTE